MTSSTTPTPTVLVVEDEALLRMMAVDMFEDAGYAVTEAATGDAGAEMLAAGQDFDGIFTDVEMPGSLNGVELANMTRSLRPMAVILVVSGRAMPSADDLPSGAQFISKPYDIASVLRTMKDLIKAR